MPVIGARISGGGRNPANHTVTCSDRCRQQLRRWRSRERPAAARPLRLDDLALHLLDLDADELALPEPAGTAP